MVTSLECVLFPGTLNKRSVSRNQRYANNHDTLVNLSIMSKVSLLELLLLAGERLQQEAFVDPFSPLRGD